MKAVGYPNGKKYWPVLWRLPVLLPVSPWTADRSVIQADNRDVAVCNIELRDKKKRFVPTARNDLTITVPVRYASLGGNGDPAYQATERPADADARTYQVKAFNGLGTGAVAKYRQAGEATLTVVSENLPKLPVLKLQK